jgi:hypothetical protein
MTRLTKYPVDKQIFKQSPQSTGMFGFLKDNYVFIDSV